MDDLEKPKIDLENGPAPVSVVDLKIGMQESDNDKIYDHAPRWKDGICTVCGFHF